MTLEQCCLGCCNSQKVWEGGWWNRHSSSDPWTVLPQLPQLTERQRRCLMGQALKYRLGWSTSGRPRSFKEDYIIGETSIKWGRKKKGDGVIIVSRTPVTNFIQYLLEQSSSDCAEYKLSLINSFRLYLIVTNTILIVVHALKPSSLAYSLQIHCIELVGSESTHPVEVVLESSPCIYIYIYWEKWTFEVLRETGGMNVSSYQFHYLPLKFPNKGMERPSHSLH